MVLGDDNHHPLLISPPESPAEDESLRVQESDDGDLIGRTWSESKKIWHIAGPAIFTRIAMFSLTVITQSLAGHLGDLDMAAISIVTTVLIGITFGFLVKS